MTLFANYNISWYITPPNVDQWMLCDHCLTFGSTSDCITPVCTCRGPLKYHVDLFHTCGLGHMVYTKEENVLLCNYTHHLYTDYLDHIVTVAVTSSSSCEL